jgi:hypothetical protein
MAFSGDVTKAYLLLEPSSCSEARVANIRGQLIDRAFIVVREEYIELTTETVTRLVCDDEVEVQTLVGRAYIFVVARAKAAEKLLGFAAELNTGVFVCSNGGNAAKGLLYLFPRMTVDPIPSTAEANDLVERELKGILVKGLTEVAKQKPENSVKWLAEYLLANNPNRPPVQSSE